MGSLNFLAQRRKGAKPAGLQAALVCGFLCAFAPLREKFPPNYLNFHALTSVKCPLIAAAAAIIGLTRCVRPPRPWRPSKLRLLVEAQRSPGCSVSAFIPKHIEQPASRHSKPASLKMRSRPSRSASRFTSCEPGTTIALTDELTR